MSTQQLALVRKIKARLFMFAILPAFEDLLQFSEPAQKLLAERSFRLRFQTSSGLRSSLHFAHNACQHVRQPAAPSDIVLHFLTEEQLNNEFENQGFRIPLPIKGAHRIKDLQVFKALSRALEQALRAQNLHRTDPTLHDFQVSLQLGIALRAVIQLTRHEPRSQRIMQETPDGLAYFSVGEERYGAWIEWKDGHISAGKHQPERQPDVSVRFNNPETALKAVGNRIDVMAAIGMGQIQVTGLVPLADALGYIFERIPLYIQP